MSVSILILSLNEETNLPDCLESVAWCDDIIVLDSGSTDRTEEIAREAGARFVQREFDDFASQRNHALDNIDFKHDWVFHLDADERFTPELVAECRRVVAEDSNSGFMAPSRMMFWGKWLRHAAQYPVYQMRLMKLGEVRFAQHGHGQRECGAKRGIGSLSKPYLHYSFSKGTSDWLTKHNDYSTAEAQQVLASLRGGNRTWRNLLSRDAIRRRRALKELSFRLPLRPWLKFLYMYVLRRGFLDGAPGLTYCALQAVYEYMICLKIKELKRREKGLPV